MDVLSDLETQAVDFVAAQVAADHVDLQGSAALAGDVNGENLLQPIDVLLIINAVSADGQISLMPDDPVAKLTPIINSTADVVAWAMVE